MPPTNKFIFCVKYVINSIPLHLFLGGSNHILFLFVFVNDRVNPKQICLRFWRNKVFTLLLYVFGYRCLTSVCVSDINTSTAAILEINIFSIGGISIWGMAGIVIIGIMTTVGIASIVGITSITDIFPIFHNCHCWWH